MDLYQGKLKKMLFRKKNDEIDLEGKKKRNSKYKLRINYIRVVVLFEVTQLCSSTRKSSSAS